MIAIVFYSFSGYTRNTCLFLKDQLTKKGFSVDTLELKPQKEEKEFLKQCSAAFKKKMPELEPVNYDLGKYTWVVVASPVWALTFAPALRMYLSKVEGLENKKIGCLLTYGSGLGAQKALKELEEVMRGKKTHLLFSSAIPAKKIKQRQFLEEVFSPLFELITTSGM